MSYRFVQARNFTHTAGRSIDVLVIHTMEAPETANTAENVAQWFAGATAPQASAHYCVDSDSIVQCVQDQDVAWHAPGANSDGLGFEHAGFASQKDRDWSDAYSTSMLDLSAGLVAAKCREFGIPVAWLTAADLRAGRRGITGHRDVSEAFRLSTHTDPGTSFPIQKYLGLVRAKLGEAPSTADKPPTKAVSKGDTGWLVKRAQKLLRSRGYPLGKPDGVFGDDMVAATKTFQSDHGLDDDGIVGPATWKRLLSAPSVSQGGSHPVLKNGAHGLDVTLLQRLLADEGCNPGAIDGAFGPTTKSAVERFQRGHGLGPDGVAGPKTWAALEQGAAVT